MYTITIKKDYVEQATIDNVPAEMIIALLVDLNQQEKTVVPPPSEKKEKVAKKYKTKKTPKTESDDEVEQPSTRSRLTPEQTTEIEDMLKAGDSVKDICEKVGVSNPTVYVIRARLKTSGELPE